MITIETPARSDAMYAELSASGLMRFLNRARRAVGLAGEVDVLLADNSTLRRLNNTFRGKNKPTDVLSFPAHAQIGQNHAGDLAISLETAAQQATAYGHTLRDEVRILLLHGLLHLAGEDHETDDGEMAAREAALRRELRLPTTLIERTRPLPTKPSKRPTKLSTSLSTKPSTKRTSSRPKAAPFAAAVESSLYFARTSPTSKAKSTTKHPANRRGVK
jgi:probable rRNA maturation factor